jgi:hypothetical protein
VCKQSVKKRKSKYSAKYYQKKKTQKCVAYPLVNFLCTSILKLKRSKIKYILELFIKKILRLTIMNTIQYKQRKCIHKILPATAATTTIRIVEKI